MSDFNPILRDLFRAHGVEAVDDGEWILFPGHLYFARGILVGRKEFPNGSQTAQLEVQLTIGDRIVVENFVGVGGSAQEADREAVQAFATGALHVLLAAFFGVVDPAQVEREEWEIAGRHRVVTMGPVVKRSSVPFDGMEWFGAFERALRASPLSPGPHWVRLFYGQMDNATMSLEVLLDNEPWEEMQESLAGADWPRAEEYLSVRIFLVIQDAESPKDAAPSKPGSTSKPSGGLSGALARLLRRGR